MDDVCTSAQQQHNYPQPYAILYTQKTKSICFFDFQYI